MKTRVLWLVALLNGGCGETDAVPRANSGGRGPGASGTGGGSAGQVSSGGNAGSAGVGQGGATEPEASAGAGGAEPQAGAAALTWRPIAPLAGGPRQETGVAALGGKMYVVGGLTPTESAVATVEVYDPTTNEWSLAAPLPKVMHHANTAALNGKLYVVGALDAGFGALGDVYVYDPLEGWSAKSPLPVGTQRGASLVAVVGSTIYIAGGLRGGYVADFSAYDPEADTHTPLPPLPMGRDHLMGGAIGNVIYAIGGRSGGFSAFYAKVDAFDLTANSWLSVADMKIPRAGAAAAVMGDRIVIAGGEGSTDQPMGVFRQTEAFVPATNSWLTLPDMTTPRHGMGAAAIDGVFYVPGGGTVQNIAATDISEALAP